MSIYNIICITNTMSIYILPASRELTISKRSPLMLMVALGILTLCCSDVLCEEKPAIHMTYKKMLHRQHTVATILDTSLSKCIGCTTKSERNFFCLSFSMTSETRKDKNFVTSGFSLFIYKLLPAYKAAN